MAQDTQLDPSLNDQATNDVEPTSIPPQPDDSLMSVVQETVDPSLVSKNEFSEDRDSSNSVKSQ